MQWGRPQAGRGGAVLTLGDPSLGRGHTLFLEGDLEPPSSEESPALSPALTFSQMGESWF